MASPYASWNSAFYYNPGDLVSWNAGNYRATSEQPNQGNQPDTSIAYWTVYNNGGINVVTAINAGEGITVDGSQTADPTISLNLLAGLGTSIQNGSVGTSATVSVVIDAGKGIDITAVAGPGGGVGDTVVVNNTGVLTFEAGEGLDNTGTAQDVYLVNTGVLSVGVGAGLQNTGTAQNPVLSSTAGNPVQYLTAGTGGITITGASATPVVNSTVTIAGYNAPGTGYIIQPSITSQNDGNGNFLVSPNLFPFVGNFILPVASPNFNFTYPGQYFITASPLNVGDLQLGFNLSQTSSKPGRYWIFNNNGLTYNNMNMFVYIYSSTNVQTIICNGLQRNPGQGIMFDLVYTPNYQNPNLGYVSAANVNGSYYSTVSVSPTSPSG